MLRLHCEQVANDVLHVDELRDRGVDKLEIGAWSAACDLDGKSVALGSRNVDKLAAYLRTWVDTKRDQVTLTFTHAEVLEAIAERPSSRLLERFLDAKRIIDARRDRR